MFNEPIEYKLRPWPSSPVSSAQWEFLFSLMVHEINSGWFGLKGQWLRGSVFGALRR